MARITYHPDDVAGLVKDFVAKGYDHAKEKWRTSLHIIDKDGNIILADKFPAKATVNRWAQNGAPAARAAASKPAKKAPRKPKPPRPYATPKPAPQTGLTGIQVLSKLCEEDLEDAATLAACLRDFLSLSGVDREALLKVLES